MRVVEIVAVLAFLGGGAALARAALRSLGSGDAGRWEAYHRAEGTARRVYVRRGAELEAVGEVASEDPEYEERFLALMDRARERASALNSEP